MIDAHVHLSVMEKGDTFEVALQKLEKEMQRNGVSHCIIIGDNVSNPGCADTELIYELVKDDPRFSIIWSIYPFRNSDKQLKLIDGLLASKKLVGLKIFPGHDRLYIGDKRFNSTIDRCLKNLIPLVIHTGINSGQTELSKYNHPSLIAKLAEENPNLQIVISHYFWPQIQVCFDYTIKLPNVYYDTSALADPEVVEASGGTNAIRTILTETLKRKPNSVMLGSDYPMCNMKAHVDLIESLSVSGIKKEFVYSRTAQELYKLPASLFH